MKSYLQAVSQKRHTFLAKLELPHFIETAFVHSWHRRLLFQAPETILRKMLQRNHWFLVVSTFFWAQTKFFPFHNETPRLLDMAGSDSTTARIIVWPYSHLKRLNVCIKYQNITAAVIYCKERCTSQAKHLTEGHLLIWNDQTLDLVLTMMTKITRTRVIKILMMIFKHFTCPNVFWCCFVISIILVGIRVFLQLWVCSILWTFRKSK